MEIKKIISHAKEYGFIFPSSDIYEGLSAVYDYAHNGVELKNNIKNSLLRYTGSKKPGAFGTLSTDWIKPL